jgi:hypothetical protein
MTGCRKDMIDQIRLFVFSILIEAHWPVVKTGTGSLAAAANNKVLLPKDLH